MSNEPTGPCLCGRGECPECGSPSSTIAHDHFLMLNLLKKIARKECYCDDYGEHLECRCLDDIQDDVRDCIAKLRILE